MNKQFIVETSARHVHVTEEARKVLLGEGNELTVRAMLSQPGQFASNERVAIVGPKNTIKNVLILGPERPATQVEISATDARTLGIAAPVRESGDIEGTPGCKIVGPCGEIEIDKGVIVAKRHIHLTPEKAEELKVTDKQIVWVKVESKDRSLVFGDVVCRVSPNFSPAMHLDTDEANAAGCSGEVWGEIVEL